MEEPSEAIWAEYSRVKNMCERMNCNQCGDTDWNIVSVERNEILGYWIVFNRCNSCQSLFNLRSNILEQ